MFKKTVIYFCFFCLFTSSILAKEKFALLIGINDYKNPKIRDLNYSEADVLYLKDALIKYARFKPENVKILLGSSATTANIKAEIYWLGDVSGKEDEVFYYFSGHGTRVEDKDGNEEDGMDEAFCPYETDPTKPSSIILDDEFGYWFNRIHADKVIVVLDCCFSGGAAGRSLENEGSKGVEMSGQNLSRNLLDINENPYARDLSIENKFIMTASDANEQSYENPTLGQGVFTYYIGEALRGNADSNKDQLITTNEIYDYTRTKTMEFAKTIRKKQTPFKFGTLEDAVVAEINAQLVEIKLYDPVLKIVGLGAGKNLVKEGDLFVVKKSLSGDSRDLSWGEEKIFKIQITHVDEERSRAKIIEEYYQLPAIAPSSYGDFYAEKLATGSLAISAEPWATVFIDGNEIGVTPLIIKEIPAGEHELEFKLGHLGYLNSISEKINIDANKMTKIIRKFQKNR